MGNTPIERQNPIVSDLTTAYTGQQDAAVVLERWVDCLADDCDLEDCRFTAFVSADGMPGLMAAAVAHATWKHGEVVFEPTQPTRYVSVVNRESNPVQGDDLDRLVAAAGNLAYYDLSTGRHMVNPQPSTWGLRGLANLKQEQPDDNSDFEEPLSDAEFKSILDRAANRSQL